MRSLSPRVLLAQQPLRTTVGPEPDILFSKPANQEQYEIAARLEMSNAVLVQGPPGVNSKLRIGSGLYGVFWTSKKPSSTPATFRSIRRKTFPADRPAGCQGLVDEAIDFCQSKGRRNLSANSSRLRLVRHLKHPVVEMQIVVILGRDAIYFQEVQARPKPSPFVPISKHLLRFRDVKGVCRSRVKQVAWFAVASVALDGANRRVKASNVAVRRNKRSYGSHELDQWKGTSASRLLARFKSSRASRTRRNAAG